MPIRATKLLRDQRGSSMIEVSLVLPILIFLLLATVNLGLVLQQYMTVTDSARAGAEYPTNWTTSSDTAGMRNAAIASAGTIPGYNASAIVFCTCGPGGSAVSCSGSCSGYGNPAQYAQVTATASLPVLYSVAGFPAHYNVQSVARMRVPGPGIDTSGMDALRSPSGA